MLKVYRWEFEKSIMEWSKIIDWLLSGAVIAWFFKWQTNQYAKIVCRNSFEKPHGVDNKF